jgi:hypothetical protein
MKPLRSARTVYVTPRTVSYNYNLKWSLILACFELLAHNLLTEFSVLFNSLYSRSVATLSSNAHLRMTKA